MFFLVFVSASLASTKKNFWENAVDAGLELLDLDDLEDLEVRRELDFCSEVESGRSQ